MTIEIQVLGTPGRDNAVFVKVDSGQSVSRLLFDCGHNCVDEIGISDISSLNALFISHFHMDHVCDFDSVFRFNFNREDGSPFLIAGPQETYRAISNRLRGLTWNLVSDAAGIVEVRELHDGTLRKTVYATRDQFEISCSDKTTPCDGLIFETAKTTVEMIQLDHGCVSAGYLVREADRENVDVEKMKSLGLTPGAWLQNVKNKDSDPHDTVIINDTQHTIGQLRLDLVHKTPGDSFAYLTDFRAEGEQFAELTDFIRDVGVVVCENNYRDADEELATKHHHLTSCQVGKLAATANVGKLILFHLSDRYSKDDWKAQLDDVRTVFPNTHWPDNWAMND